MRRFLSFLAVLAVLFSGLASAGDSHLMKKLVKEYKANTLKRLPKNGTCTAENIVVRKEWYASHLPLDHYFAFASGHSILSGHSIV